MARVIGKIMASFPGVMYGPLYYRYLKRDNSQALKSEKRNFDAYMVLSPKAKSELTWWVSNVEVAYQSLDHEAPQRNFSLMLRSQVGGQNFEGSQLGGTGQRQKPKITN